MPGNATWFSMTVRSAVESGHPASAAGPAAPREAPPESETRRPRWRTARTDIVLLVTRGAVRLEFGGACSRIDEGEFAVVRAGERYRLVAAHTAEVIAVYGTTVSRPRVETIELGGDR